jgi:hypothetical protein
MADAGATPSVCLAELIAALSLGTDLGLGQPMEHVLRQCVIALGMADCFELDEAERSVVYYVSLLAWVGCLADLTSRLGGSETTSPRGRTTTRAT